jgi:group I intron endonuclease
MAVIYQITNMLTGDFYIGSAQSFSRRKWQHEYDLKLGKHKNPHMQASWNKYGADAFVFEILEEVSDDVNVLEVENTYLHRLVGRDDCFNVNRDAIHSRLGQKLSAASKAKISASRTGKSAGSDHYRYGQTVSDEVRSKISATQKGRPSPRKGKAMSDAGRANVAAAVKRGAESHFYGRRPLNADEMQKSVKIRYGDGRIETYPSLSYIRDTFGVGMNTIIRACTGRTRITQGVFAGCELRYENDAVGFSVADVPAEYAGLPTTRTEAKRVGARKYFTGKPCARGHVVPRYTKGECVACASESAKARRA